ncbi:MAG: N-acetylglucosamine-6-phosphate deacetylase [Cytophagales bacterium]|nr:N-acetylglucosamine-6-phosphate deacetylase [Armatimonadota bacterium]
MSESLITVAGARIVTPGGILEDGVVMLAGGRIRAVERTQNFVLLGGTVIDATGLTLLPGFLDVHVHGGGGADAMDASPAALRTICRTHAAHGTTGLLLTTITQSQESIGAALVAARDAVRQGVSFCPDGATPLGIHLEGPYLCSARAGAQPREFIRDYEAGEFAQWLEIADGTLKLMTLAPERPSADALIARARAAGVVVSIGHTDADTAQTMAALDAGVSHATHLFNAMPPLHHRLPGPIAPLLTDTRVLAEIIADGHHLAPEVVRLVVSAKGAGGVALITDAMAGAGAGEGTYSLGGHSVTVTDGRATLADGTLAGSVLTMDRAAANVRSWSGMGWEAIVRMTSTNVADEMGWEEKGRIVPGADADFVLVDDALTVYATYVAGQCVYHRSEAAAEETAPALPTPALEGGVAVPPPLASPLPTPPSPKRRDLGMGSIAARLKRLEEPHIRPLTDFVGALRDEVSDPKGVPWFDPADGGTDAQILLLLETPGGRGAGSGFVSSNNPDSTARNLWEMREASGLKREQTLIWNIVPWYVGEEDWGRTRGSREDEVAKGAKHLERLLGLLPHLRVVVTMGVMARAGWQHVPSSVAARCQVMHTWHPSDQSLTPYPERREELLQTLKDARYALKRAH